MSLFFRKGEKSSIANCIIHINPYHSRLYRKEVKIKRTHIVYTVYMHTHIVNSAYWWRILLFRAFRNHPSTNVSYFHSTPNALEVDDASVAAVLQESVAKVNRPIQRHWRPLSPWIVIALYFKYYTHSRNCYTRSKAYIYVHLNSLHHSVYIYIYLNGLIVYGYQ